MPRPKKPKSTKHVRRGAESSPEPTMRRQGVHAGEAFQRALAGDPEALAALHRGMKADYDAIAPQIAAGVAEVALQQARYQHGLGAVVQAVAEVGAPVAPTISNREAARLYADWTGTKPNPKWIGTLIAKGDKRLRVEADGRTTEEAVKVLVAHILKARSEKNGKSQPAAAPPSWDKACPRCGKMTYALMGAAQVCHACFYAGLNLPD